MSDGVLERERTVGATMDELNYFLHFQNGIGNSLAGGILLVICLINWLIGSDFLAALLSIGLSVGWVYCNNALRSYYYFSLGDGTLPQIAPVRYHQPGSVAFFALKAIDRAMLLLYRYWRKVVIVCFALPPAFWLIPNITNGTILQPSALITLFLMGTLPVIVRRFLRSPIEAIAACLLMLICVGSSNGSLGSIFYAHPDSFLVISLCLFVIGVLEHLYFVVLQSNSGEPDVRPS